MDYQNQYVEMVKNSPLCIHELSTTAHLTAMNEAGLCMLGLNQESDVVGLEYFSAVCDDNRNHIKNCFEKALAGETVKFEFSGVGTPIKHYKSNFIPIRDENGKVYKVMGISEDVTASVNLLNQISTKEAKYRNLVENMAEGLIQVDQNETIIFINPAFCKITGYSEQELLGKVASSILLPRDEDVETIKKDMMKRADGVATQRELLLRRKSGKLRWVLRSGSPLHDTDGNFVGSLGFVQDITDQKMAAEKLKTLNSELETFVYKASHDLRGPISSTIGLLTLLEDGASPEQKEIIEKIIFSTQKMDSILMDFSRIGIIQQGELKIERVNVRNTVEEVLKFIGAEYSTQQFGIEFNLNISEDIYLATDTFLLHGICQNLVENAVKYRKLALSHKTKIKIDAFNEVDGVKIVIADNGKGIAPDQLKKIFNMFYRASHDSQGSGLGLYMVKNAIDKLSGWVSVKSVEKTGSTFTFYIPQAKS